MFPQVCIIEPSFFSKTSGMHRRPIEGILLVSNLFSSYWPKNRINQTNSEAWVLMKVRCVIYQWIRLDKLYMLKFFFQILESFFKLTTIFKKIIVALGLCMRGLGGICADQHAFQFSDKLTGLYTLPYSYHQLLWPLPPNSLLSLLSVHPIPTPQRGHPSSPSHLPYGHERHTHLHIRGRSKAPPTLHAKPNTNTEKNTFHTCTTLPHATRHSSPSPGQ